MQHHEGVTLKAFYTKLLASLLLCALPILSSTVHAAAPSTGPVLLFTADSINDEVEGAPGINALGKQNVKNFMMALKTLLDGSGVRANSLDLTETLRTQPANAMQRVLTGGAERYTHAGEISWDTKDGMEFFIHAKFHTLEYPDGKAKIGNVDLGKRLLMFVAAKGKPEKSAEALAADFHTHLLATVFKK